MVTAYCSLQVRGLEQNTAVNGNAKTEKFITAKISCNALHQGSGTNSVLRQRSSKCTNITLPIKNSGVKHTQPTTGQFILQKYPATRYNRGVEQTQCYVSAVHNCTNITLPIKNSGVKHTQPTTGQFTIAKISGCANVSSRLSKIHKNWECA